MKELGMTDVLKTVNSVANIRIRWIVHIRYIPLQCNEI